MSDKELLGAFLGATADYSTREAGELIGVSGQRVSEWRRGNLPNSLQAANRRAIQRYMDGVSAVDDIESAEQTIAETFAEEIEALRRLAKSTKESKTKLAIIDIMELVHDRGQIPYPHWLVRLRTEAES